MSAPLPHPSASFGDGTSGRATARGKIALATQRQCNGGVGGGGQCNSGVGSTLAVVAAPRQSVGESVAASAGALWHWRQRRQHSSGVQLGGGVGSLASARHWRRRHNQHSTKGVGGNGIRNGDNDSDNDDDKNKGDGGGGGSLAAARRWRRWQRSGGGGGGGRGISRGDSAAVEAAAWQQRDGSRQCDGSIGSVLAVVAAPRQSIGNSVVATAGAQRQWRRRHQHSSNVQLGGGGSISLASAWRWRWRHNQQSTKSISGNGVGNGNDDSDNDDDKNKGGGGRKWTLHTR